MCIFDHQPLSGTETELIIKNAKKCCCVCGENDCLSSDYSQCPYDHNICKTCYLSILHICYCKNELGDIIYKCPLCRNEHKIENKQMNIILLDLTGSDSMCLTVHKLCENKQMNITKKCQFENCGCRTNVVDIITQDQIDLAIKDIIYVADKYSKKNLSPLKP
jgi:hypothetical protein